MEAVVKPSEPHRMPFSPYIFACELHCNEPMVWFQALTRIPLAHPVVAFCHGDPETLDLQVRPLHMFQQCTNEVDLAVNYLGALSLSLGGGWVGQSTNLPSLLSQGSRQTRSGIQFSCSQVLGSTSFTHCQGQLYCFVQESSRACSPNCCRACSPKSYRTSSSIFLPSVASSPACHKWLGMGPVIFP